MKVYTVFVECYDIESPWHYLDSVHQEKASAQIRVNEITGAGMYRVPEEADLGSHWTVVGFNPLEGEPPWIEERDLVTRVVVPG